MELQNVQVQLIIFTMKNKKTIAALTSPILVLTMLVQSVLLHATWGIVLSFLALILLVASWFAPPPVDVEALIADLRRQGIYPPAGSGTDADVKNVLQSGHKLLAIRLYKEIHQVPLKQAVEAVKHLN